MLDSNVYDKIIEQIGMTEVLAALHHSGQIEIIITHIQEDELSRIPNTNKRELVMKVPGNRVTTEGAIWNVSRFGEATFGAGGGDIKIEDIQKGNPNHSEDALIANTAAARADILVTDEKTLPKRIRTTGSKIKVWDFSEFQEYINKIKCKSI